MGKFDKDILGRLAALGVDEINTALAAIRADRESLSNQAPTTESVAALNELVGYARQLVGRRDEINNLAAAQVTAFGDLDTLTDVPAPADPPAPEPAPEPAPAPAAPPAPEPAPEPAPAPAADPAPEPEGVPQGDGLTASGLRPLGRRRSGVAGPASALGQVSLTTEAATGLRGYEGGQRLTRAQLADAFAAKGRATQGRNIAGYERHVVATVRSQFPEDRTLNAANSWSANVEKVERVVAAAKRVHALDNLAAPVQVRSGPDGEGALVAAGLCAPLENLYDIRVVGDTDRPIRDALVRFGAERGGIQYRPALEGVSQTGGIGVWTATNDEADPIVPKTCVEIDCPGVLTAEVDAIYQCLTFSNMSTRFDPEWMDSTVQAQAIAHARFAENRLYAQIRALSKVLYSTRELGATRDILFVMDKITAYYKNVHRYNDEQPLRWIAPSWARNLMRADITRQMVGDGLQSLEVTDQAIARWLAVRNINPTWHLDGIDPADITAPTPDIVVPAQYYTSAAANTEVPEFPTAIDSLLFADGDMLHLDGGTLDLGVVRDSTLNGENRFQTFSENFETVASRGIEPLALVIEALPTGESAATADTTPAP